MRFIRIFASVKLQRLYFCSAENVDIWYPSPPKYCTSTALQISTSGYNYELKLKKFIHSRPHRYQGTIVVGSFAIVSFYFFSKIFTWKIIKMLSLGLAAPGFDPSDVILFKLTHRKPDRNIHLNCDHIDSCQIRNLTQSKCGG